MKRTIILFALIFVNFYLNGQTNDEEYYKNWAGVWYEEIDGKVNDKPSFIIRQGLYEESFEEIWFDKGGTYSKAWRAWDKRTKKMGICMDFN